MNNYLKLIEKIQSNLKNSVDSRWVLGQLFQDYGTLDHLGESVFVEYCWDINEVINTSSTISRVDERSDVSRY
jgi:hypothetical protein